MSKIGNILIILALVIVSGFVGWYYAKKSAFSQKQIAESATVTLDRIEKVFKFVASEGNVSEIYNYKDYQYYDISLFRKKILVRVNAKVLVGYDFENASFTVDEESKTIFLDSLPQPTILAIDHDLDYYDIQEGSFNSFSEEELNDISDKAKAYASEVAQDSDLFQSAEEQKDELLKMLELSIRGMGWEFVVQQDMLKN